MERWTRPWARLARDQSGAALIEFAFVGPLFLLTMLAVFDVSWMFTRNMALDSGTRAVARDIRTGEIFLASNPEVEFRRRLCVEMIIVDCGEVLVDIRDAGMNFSDVAEPAAFTPETFQTAIDPSGLTGADRMGMVNFTAGAPSSVMTVRIGVEHQFMTPMLHRLWGDGQGQVQFTVTEIFRNEPFPDGT